ncbi:unnamed protein product [Meganyctiphanes norvegica]|uniref:Cuticle protein n=1 Tax=Meganyctiphanes norvegica TaxID=48144 RepID=A0AAV2REZ9_MEGNR
MTPRIFLCMWLLYSSASAMPAPQGEEATTMMPMNYNFEWNVDSEDYQNYYGQREAADNGRVEGVYYVWQPDGRLRKVEYYVDGDSGFVPTITYVDAYEPAWGTTAFDK